MRRAIFISILLLMTGGTAWAEPPTAIESIMRDLQAYHLHRVTLKGTVRNPQKGPSPIQGELRQCYDSYYFMLEDATGSIPVQFGGVCGPPGTSFHLTEGQSVMVEGFVVWNGEYPGSAYVATGNPPRVEP